MMMMNTLFQKTEIWIKALKYPETDLFRGSESTLKHKELYALILVEAVVFGRKRRICKP